MLTFDAPSLPSTLAVRECSRPRFDDNLERLHDWLGGLRTVGVRQAGPALLMALENLRKAEISANRRLSVLSALKAPLLKTCAGLPKPRLSDEERLARTPGVTLEQRLYRLMFVNLNQGLRELDQRHALLSNRQRRKREWAIRNLFRFANRQIRFAALWKTPLPENTWRDLHELHLHLHIHLDAAQSTRAMSTPPMSTQFSEISTSWIDPNLEYKKLLLFGLAARLKNSVVRGQYFLDGLDGWAAQTRLEDPERMLGRVRLFLVEMTEDEPPRQQISPLDTLFRGWVLQTPYPFIHQLEDGGMV